MSRDAIRNQLDHQPHTRAMHVVIIGGGVMGAATASFLASRFGVRATVLERDASYARASSALSVCAIRQQFSTEINIRVSQASLLFYRDIAQQLAVGDDRPNIGLTEPGYLYLATQAGAAVLHENQALQRACGASVALLTPQDLAARYPWLTVSDLALGSLGLSAAHSGEGWFDGYRALQAFRQHALAHGAQFVEAEAMDFVQQGGTVSAVVTANGTQVPCDAVVVTAGAWTSRLTTRLGTPLPIHARKRDVFSLQADRTLPACPLVIDPSGFWFRPDGDQGQFLCGAPPRGDDVDDAPLDHVDHGLFDEWLWPKLAERVPAFDALRVTGAWAGYYEYNSFDQNGLVGRLPGTHNTFVAAGFSGHGLQQAPAIGLGIAELVATGAYQSLDLSPFTVERIERQQPLLERNVI
jgi:FAD-dependent oxidoreductase domain-containing protein 1